MIGGTGTIYTTIGGLKAVIWTDTLQAAFMYLGLGTVIVKGTVDAGGLWRVWQIAIESGRIATLNRFDINPAQVLADSCLHDRILDSCKGE